MRSALFCLPLFLAAGVAAQAPVACGDAALEAAPDVWDAANVVTGDFTLDGSADVAFWRREEASVLLYIAACDGDRAVETWRFRVTEENVSAGQSPVQVITPLMDDALVNRVCAAGATDECVHMRRENERRQAIADAGGRELLVGSAATGVRFRWSSEAHGFMRIGSG